MQTRIVELTNGFNWGKFMVCRFDRDDWSRRSALGEDDDPLATVHVQPLLARCGWSPDVLWVLDLQTGEGALFRLGGNARADLEKHRIWVCPMFEVFLAWLYRHPSFDDLPAILRPSDLDAREASAMYGRRRRGPSLCVQCGGSIGEALCVGGGQAVCGAECAARWDAEHAPGVACG